VTSGEGHHIGLPRSCAQTIETPCYSLVLNATSFQVRLYGAGLPQAWSTAAVVGSFSDATQEGFQANFDYIEGANSASVKIPMTAPVLARPTNTSDVAWRISFFTPTSLYPLPQSIPAPTSSDVTLDIVPANGVLVATTYFPGFATYDDFLNAEISLRGALLHANLTPVDANGGADFARVYVQYDSPFSLFNRHNEVWLQLQ
jgi:SOUL heme-binding protein